MQYTGPRHEGRPQIFYVHDGLTIAVGAGAELDQVHLTCHMPRTSQPTKLGGVSVLHSGNVVMRSCHIDMVEDAGGATGSLEFAAVSVIKATATLHRSTFRGRVQAVACATVLARGCSIAATSSPGVRALWSSEVTMEHCEIFSALCPAVVGGTQELEIQLYTLPASACLLYTLLTL